MGKSGKKTTSKTTGMQTLDSGSQGYVDQMRQYGQGAGALINAGGSYFTGPQTMSIGEQISPFMNPYMGNVIGALGNEYDHLRDQAGMRTNQAATAAGAFGGSRHGIAEGVRMGELDRAQMSQTAGLLQSGYQNAMNAALPYWEQQRQLQEQQLQEPFWRYQQGLGMMNLGMGPVGWNTTSSSKQRESSPSTMGTLGGMAVTGLGLASGLGWAPFAANAVSGAR